MPDEPDPPRKFYQLKPREFERVNEPPGAFVPQAHKAEPDQPSRPVEIGELYRQAQTPGPLLAKTHAVTSNEVHTILRDNLTRANAAGLNELKPQPKRRSRRTRDYFLVLIALNAFFAFAAFGPYANAITLAYGIAGMIFTTLGLTWVMFFIMDDY